jgi:hypothetical protein
VVKVQGEAVMPAQPEVSAKDSQSAKALDATDESLRRQMSLDARDPARLREIKAAARGRIEADRAQHEVKPASAPEKAGASKQRAATVSTDSRGLAQKMKMLPLVAPPAAGVECNRQGDIERVTAERLKADNAGERDRLGLDLAAAHVGAGENDKALVIYEDLAQHAVLEGVRQTAIENIKRIGGKAASNNAGASTK